MPHISLEVEGCLSRQPRIKAARISEAGACLASGMEMHKRGDSVMFSSSRASQETPFQSCGSPSRVE